jgi:GNAT acetyltransferase-like protein
MHRLFRDTDTTWRIVGTRASGLSRKPVVKSRSAGPPKPFPGMVLDLIPEAPSQTPAGLEIERMRTLEELQTCFRVGWEEMGAPVDLWDPLLATGGPKLLDGPAGFYLVRLDGHSVAISLGFPTDGSTGVFFVNTLPAFRKQGIGATSTWAAARHGAELGFRVSGLQASKLGQSKYHGMGFQTAVEYVQWMHGNSGAPAGP